jgi:aspartate/methionine/tyrosine aminotransferase
MVIHHPTKDADSNPMSSMYSHPLPIAEQHSVLRQLRHELLVRYRPLLMKGAGPIRVMARVVAELEQQCRARHIAEEVIQSEIVNRTIGDINLRLITECEGEPGGPGDYRILADELGVALPGEQINGYTASGETYLWLRTQMMECERMLLEQHYDPRIYDIYGVGNALLRSWLTQEMSQWGIEVPVEQLYISLGAMDGIDKVLRGVRNLCREQGIEEVGILFPEPGFNVPEVQARSFDYRMHSFPTLPENSFKLTAAQLDSILSTTPDLRLIYLTVTNNPTALAYTPDELNALHDVLRSYRDRGRDILLLADLAYIGTGPVEADRARMATFAAPDVLRSTIFVSSYSKTYSLTGERFGWVTIGNPELAPQFAASWTNSMASLPGEWQLRFMAYHCLLQSRPQLSEKLRNFYRLRRRRLIAQLQRINATHPLFAQLYLDDDATVYHWCRLAPGEDAFSLFEHTGIAGVPGSGFGYSDEYVRFSIGVIPVPNVEEA